MVVPHWPASSVRNTLDSRRRTNSLYRTPPSFADATKTSLISPSQTADASSLLKSISQGVLEIWLIAERIEASRDDARRLAERCVEILHVINNSVPDPKMQ
ncbi:hypothetical protein C0993_006468, partial [Termitomyces sp. T159_Od127]